MRFEVTIPARSRRVRAHRIEVEAENWMVALREGLAELDLPALVMSRVLCDIQPDGTVLLQDTHLERKIEVRPLSTTRTGGQRPTKPKDSKPGTPTLTYLDAQLVKDLRARAEAGAGGQSTPVGLQKFSQPLPFFQIPEEVSDELKRVYNAPKETRPPQPRKQKADPGDAGAKVAAKSPNKENMALYNVKRPVRYLPYVEVAIPPRGRISFMNLDLSELRDKLKGKKVSKKMVTTPPSSASADYRNGWVRESVAALGRHATDLEAFVEGLLQLTTAAIPSRMAWLLLSTPDGRELAVSGAAGEGARHFLGRRITGDKDLASVCVQGGISIRISDLQRSRHPVSLMPNQKATLERSVLCGVRRMG